MRKTLFIKNALILTATGLILRFLGIIFKVWLAAGVGSEGIGLYHLVFSVYTFTATFASGGITIAVTKLCAREITTGSREGLYKILRRATAIVLAIALVTFAVVLFSSEFIALRLINDIRSEESLAIMAFSLPFMGISAVLKGYFVARRKVGVNSAAVLLEQAVRIGLCLYFVKAFAPMGLGMAVAGVLLGDTVAEIVSCVFTVICFKADLKKVEITGSREEFYSVKQILGISTPITAGRYGTSLLRTAENILMPKALSKFGGNFSHSLSLFGSLKGMALPLLFFPASLLSAFSSLLIPEISEAMAKKQPKIIKRSIEASLKLTLIMGFIAGGIFFFAGERLGSFIYGDRDCGYLIALLAPLTPIMYCDSMCDGILKGLDQQLFTFRNTIMDSALRIILILLIVPKMGMNGFIYIMYFSNLLTFTLNFTRVIKVTGAKIKIWEEIILPLTATVGICGAGYAATAQIANNWLFAAGYAGIIAAVTGTVMWVGRRKSI